MEPNNNETLIHPHCKKAILVAILHDREPAMILEELDELEALLATLGITAADRLIQKGKLTPSHLMGVGKAEEARDLAKAAQASLIVVDHNLSGPQVRNLETLTLCQVVDRSAVILDIFARHAKTNQAKAQVEIAKLEYMLPRFAGAWTHFQRQSGGGLANRGMGEKQIEIDRRRARERISRLQKRLEQIAKERATQRKLRQNEIKVAIVGYTNSGKTTVMKALTRSQIEGKDELFATLDASIRTIDPSTRPKILLSDTVGFIRNLPHSLVESFRSTLDEAANSDLLLHVVDVSCQNYQAQMKITEEVLEDIGAGEVPTILVFNKADLITEKFLPKILRKTYAHSITISALHQKDILDLRAFIFQYFENTFLSFRVRVPSSNSHTLSLIHQNCVILEAEYTDEHENDFLLRAPSAIKAKLEPYLVEDSGASLICT